MQYKDYVINRQTTVAEALAILERNEYKALIVEEAGVLFGILTDGDIRRFLINKNNNLSLLVDEASTKTPRSVTGYHESAARLILDELDCTVVPMLDETNHIHAIVFKDATLHRNKDNITNHVIIMAGGFGTRLYPYTEILPKPLLPIGNATVTELIIERFRKFGCKDISLVVNYRKNLIKSYFSEVEKDYSITFVDEDKPLGTGGGLAFFKGQFNEPVFVTYCDNVIEADYSDILFSHQRDSNILTMVVARKKTNIPYGVIEISDDGEILDMVEKPEQEYLINTGFYVVSPEFISLVDNGKFQHITDLAMLAKQRGYRIGSYLIEDNCFIDIGQLNDLREVGSKLR